MCWKRKLPHTYAKEAHVAVGSFFFILRLLSHRRKLHLELFDLRETPELWDQNVISKIILLYKNKTWNINHTSVIFRRVIIHVCAKKIPTQIWVKNSDSILIQFDSDLNQIIRLKYWVGDSIVWIGIPNQNWVRYRIESVTQCLSQNSSKKDLQCIEKGRSKLNYCGCIGCRWQ